MCFGSKKDSSNDPAPKPAQIPQHTSSSAPPASALGKMNQDFAPPAGPPPSRRPEDYAAPSGPPPSHSQANNFAPPAGPPPSHAATDFAPPPGPPPRRNDDYAPPSGPPPRQDFAPPPGPPPSKGHGAFDDFAPPPGPPPPQQSGKKHAWEEAVPDTSELPPPPPFFAAYDFSPTNNATEEEAEAGEAFCRSNPMHNPETLDPTNAQAQQQSNFRLLWMNDKVNIAPVALGVWKGFSKDGTTDTSIVSWPPLYSVSAHSPLATRRTKVIYYEVNFLKDSRQEISMALGFAVPPYPGFRLPGWHRGSLAVHGDDGRKYINDRWGGKDFAQPFKRGETVGIGMKFVPNGGGISVKIFLTRNGVHQPEWAWDLYEESDKAQDGSVEGLDGFRDVCAAVGVFEKVHFEIVFAPWRWKWQGLQDYSMRP